MEYKKIKNIPIIPSEIGLIFAFIGIVITFFIHPANPLAYLVAFIFLFILGFILFCVSIMMKKIYKRVTKLIVVLLHLLKRKPLNFIIFLTCVVISAYFSILVYKQLKPKSYEEKYMHCLELGSNLRSQQCLRQLGSKK